MKRTIFLVFSLFCISLMATTYTSPTLEGIIDTITPVSWGHYEDFETETFSAADYTLWITWDADNLYVGIDRDTDIDNRYLGDSYPDDLSLFVAIDTDQTPGSGATSDGYNRVTFSGGYLPEYCFYFAGGGGWAEWSTWTGTAWNWNGWTDDWGYYGWSGGNIDDELQITWARLGDPTGIVFKAWITGEGDGTVLASWPTENPVGVSPDLPWGYQFYSNHMVPVNGPLPLVGVQPNQTEHSTEEPPTPVVLSSFTAEYVNNSLNLNWTTQSETDNSGWNIYRSETSNLEEANQINKVIIDGAGTTSEPTEYTYVDQNPVIIENTYWYWIESRDGAGTTLNYGPISITIPSINEDDPIPPNSENPLALHNYPNPFYQKTEISFIPKEEGYAEISIYNTKGQKIISLFNNKITDAELNKPISVAWNGMDETGNRVLSGIYLSVLKIGGNTYTKKMVITK